jgi:hypothetical protein
MGRDCLPLHRILPVGRSAEILSVEVAEQALGLTDRLKNAQASFLAYSVSGDAAVRATNAASPNRSATLTESARA